MIIVPIGDRPNDPKRVAWMNYTLIAANAAVFLLMQAGGGGSAGYNERVMRWAYDPAQPTTITLFSSLFLHADIWHLGGNMLFLWIFGDNVEARLGAFPYLILYLILGAAATLVYGAVGFGDELVPVIGASGAISGVQGLYFVACPQHQVRIFFWFLIVIVRVFYMNARWLMLLWFVANDIVPLMIGYGPTGGGVAHAAHLGGFAAGFFLMLLLRPFVDRIRRAAEDELSHVHRYQPGRVREKRYEHARRRHSYGARHLRPQRTAPPPLPPSDELPVARPRFPEETTLPPPLPPRDDPTR